MMTAILILLVAALGFLVWMLLHWPRNEVSAFVEQSLARFSADLAERVARSSGETKEAMMERFTKEFLLLREKIEAQLAASRADQETRLRANAQAMETRLEEIRDKVDKRLLNIAEQVQTRLDKSLQEGFQQYEKGQETLKNVYLELQSLSAVGGSITELNSLLKLPHLRGSFGEMELEDLLADFLPASAYEVQKQATRGHRPDAIIKFPKNYLPIDSKFPREQVLPLFEKSGPEALEAARGELSRVLKAEAKDIHDKYIRPDEGSMDMALMFLPSETLYFEVIRNVDLCEQMSRLKVFPVSPNTLAVTLKAISIAHDYYQMAQNVEHTIEEVNKARKHFENFEERFEEVGDRLRKAQEAFDKASTNLSRYSSAVVRLTGEAPAAPLRSASGDARPATGGSPAALTNLTDAAPVNSK